MSMNPSQNASSIRILIVGHATHVRLMIIPYYNALIILKNPQFSRSPLARGVALVSVSR
jgi:hypothetical protein